MQVAANLARRPIVIPNLTKVSRSTAESLISEFANGKSRHEPNKSRNRAAREGSYRSQLPSMADAPGLLGCQHRLPATARRSDRAGPPAIRGFAEFARRRRGFAGDEKRRVRVA